MSTQHTPGGVDGRRTEARSEVRNDGAPRNAWQLVAAREMAVKVRDRNFLVGTVVTTLLILGLMAFNVFMGSRGSSTTIAVVDPGAKAVAQQVGQAMHAADDKDTVTVKEVGDRATAEREVREDKADVVLAREGQGWAVTGKGQPSDQVLTYTRQVVSQQTLAQVATRAGTTPEQVSRQTAVSPHALVGDDDKKITGLVVGGVFAFLFYFASITFGMQIAQSVIEEKQSRIVEILAAAIPVRQLLAGKVLGNTVIAVAQMTVYVVIGVVGLSFTSYKSMLPAVSTGLAWGLAFFLAGFLALSCLWAVAGSLSTRNEDLQQTATPMTMLLMLGFFASFMAKGVWLTALSFVPVMSSMLMPGRLVSGDASWWQGLVALLVTLAFAAVTVVLGERMYRRSLMQTSTRMTFRQALAAKD